VLRAEPQATESLRFDLSNAFTPENETLTHLFEGVLARFADPEPHAKHLCFGRGQGVEPTTSRTY
jgi:hypothetical protein